MTKQRGNEKSWTRQLGLRPGCPNRGFTEPIRIEHGQRRFSPRCPQQLE
jgi:hypothetical protein